MKTLQYSAIAYGIGFIISFVFSSWRAVSLLETMFWVELTISMLFLLAGITIQYRKRDFGGVLYQQNSVDQYAKKVEEILLSPSPVQEKTAQKKKERERQGLQLTFVGLILFAATLFVSYFFQV